MTPIVLLEQLKEFVEEYTNDIILQVRPIVNKTTPEYQGNIGEAVTSRAAEVHLMNLPDKNAVEQRIPYIVLRLLTGKDSQARGESPESECKIRIIAVTYSENDSMGGLDALNVITRIRIALLKAGQVGQFLLLQPVEYLVYDEDTKPYHIAEMILIFEMPEITREFLLF